ARPFANRKGIAARALLATRHARCNYDFAGIKEMSSRGRRCDRGSTLREIPPQIPSSKQTDKIPKISAGERSRLNIDVWGFLGIWISPILLGRFAKNSLR